jgi:hypothetical protein
MRCVKTGACVYIREYHCWIVCDLIQVADVFVISADAERTVRDAEPRPTTHRASIRDAAMMNNVFIIPCCDVMPV